MRLNCHQLFEPQFTSPEEVVTWMGAVQGQEYAMCKWAVGVRLKNGTLQQVNEALRSGELVRTHIMRPTWHLVAGKDLRWMLQLSGQKIRKIVDQWTKGCGVDIPESLYTRCNDLFGKILSGGYHLTKEELTGVFEQAGIRTDDNLMRRYLLRAEVERIICSGGDKEGKPTYALLEEHIAPAPELSYEEALVELAVRYFRSHSPATLKDFVWWSGLSVTEAKAGIAGAKLLKECWEGQEFWMTDCRLKVEKKEILHFLPSYDEYLIGYKDRQTVLKPQYFSKAFNRWGIFYPVILYNGEIVGNWNKVVKKNRLSVNTSFFGSLQPEWNIEADLLQRAESRFRNFMVSSEEPEDDIVSSGL